MATKKHKPKKARKSRKGHKTSRKGKRGKKGLSGTSTAAKAMSYKNALKETGKTAGGTLLGLLGSAALGFGIDKIGFIQVKETDGKVMAAVKKSIKPLSLILVGGVGSTVSRAHGAKFFAAVADGLIIGGAFSGVKAIVGSKTNLFNGLGATDEQLLSNTAKYYQENLDTMKQVLDQNKEILKLSGFNGTETPELNMGSATNPANDLNINASMIQ